MTLSSFQFSMHGNLNILGIYCIERVVHMSDINLHSKIIFDGLFVEKVICIYVLFLSILRKYMYKWNC